jgi:hypothetical protein
MLKKWTTHSDYLSHLNREIDSLSPHEKNRLFKLHQNSHLKLSLLNLDPLLRLTSRKPGKLKVRKFKRKPSRKYKVNVKLPNR